MKQRILLFMMTALLSVGAWAENLWSGSETLAYYGFQLTDAVSMSAGDVLTFTVTATTQSWAGIKLKTVARSSDDTYNVPGTELISTSAAVGTVMIVVTSEVAAAAADKGLWLDGNDCTVTSVDYEKAVGVNLYTNAEGNAMNYYSMQLSSPNLLYAKTGDVLRVTVSDVSSNEYWRKLILQDAEGGVDAGNTLYTCENTSLTAGTLDIRLTDELIAKAQAGSLYIGGYEYTFTAVDLYLTSPTVSIDASAGYATFGYPVALDLTGIEAYTVTVSGGKAQLNSIQNKKIPAGTGIILKGTGDVTISLTTEATDDITGNELLVSDGTVTGDGTIFVLGQNSEGKVGFGKLNTDDVLPAGKAYLTIPKESRDFIALGDDVTGIDEVRSKTDDGRGVYFDLQGRRVAQPTKGLYIVNGKKIIIK